MKYALAVLTLALVSCGGPSPVTPVTPTTPTPPQVQTANYLNALAQALDAAVIGLRSARDAGTLTPATVATAEKVAAIMATAGKQIDAELRSTDPWTTQQSVILRIITSTGLSAAYRSLPLATSAYVAASVAVFNSISLAVGGPQI